MAGTSVVEGVTIDWVSAQPEAHLDLPAEWLDAEQVAAELAEDRSGVRRGQRVLP